MSIHTNEAGTIKNIAADGNRIAVRLWPDYSSPYSTSVNAYYHFDIWVDPDRPYLTITNPSVDYIWPFIPDYIVYMPCDVTSSYSMSNACIIRQGAEPITKPVGSTFGGWLCMDVPYGSTGTSYWVYGQSNISLSGNAMTVTYFNVDRSKDKHSEDDHREVCGIYIAVAE